MLSSASRELVQKMLSIGQTKTFSEEQEIFAEGESAIFLPVILSGKIKMVRFLEPGKEVIISVFQKGEMFAVPPVFDGGPYPSSAFALEDSKILMLYRPQFLQLLKESNEFSFAVISWMCEMLREKTATIQNLAFASPEHKIGNVLLRVAEKGSGIEEKEFKVSLRRQDIAEMAGLRTETAIRVIRKLAEKNLLKIRNGKIIIENLETLRSYLKS